MDKITYFFTGDSMEEILVAIYRIKRNRENIYRQRGSSPSLRRLASLIESLPEQCVSFDSENRLIKVYISHE